MPKERGEHGQFIAAAEPQDVLGVFEAVKGPAVTTTDVAEALGCTRETARRKLEKLIAQGEVAKRRTAGRPVLYWRPDGASSEGDTDGEGTTEQREEDATRSRRGRSRGSNTTELSGERESAGGAGAGLEDVEFPAGRDRDECLAAVAAARDYLQEHGSATMRELVAEVMPNHPLGYDVDDAIAKVEAGERYRGAWWRRVVKPGLKAIDEVAAPPSGASEWRYTGG